MDSILAQLERYVPLAPLHQPHNLAPIRSILARFPKLPQVACFDTPFHRGHSAVADHYAIPEHLHAEGVRRYGFHGLSARALPPGSPGWVRFSMQKPIPRMLRGYRALTAVLRFTLFRRMRN
jgi:acetate kinase